MSGAQQRLPELLTVSSGPLQALRRINSSVSTTDVKRHLAYMKEFGSV